MIRLTDEEILELERAAGTFDGHVTHGSSAALRVAVEQLILKYVKEWTR